MLTKLLKIAPICVILAVGGGYEALANPLSVVANQKQECKGRVIDPSGAPIAGASILVKGTRTGTLTDHDGNFALTSVKKGSTLEVSFLGFETKEVKWEGSNLTITLNEDKQQLNEVVVTALGINKQARSVGYATTRVDKEQIERASALSPVNALQGKVAGVQINQGGASGITSSSSITIRGAKSIDKNNAPIFVIDGMVIQEPLTGNLDGTDWGSQLKNLNPADYESVTVLKGAAATALYGSRGANGAIVIVSKGGKYGKQGIGVEFNQTCEWTQVYKAPIALQNEYGMGHPFNGTQGGFNQDGSLPLTSNSFGPKMQGQEVNQNLPNGEKTAFSPKPNNWKDFYQTGLNTITNVAITGGGEHSSFRLSYGYTDNKGVFIRNNFSRHNLSFKGLTDLNKVFSIELGLKMGFSSALNGGNQGGWNWGNNVGMLTAYYLPRNYDVAAFYKQYRNKENHSLVPVQSFASTLSGYFHTRDTEVNQRDEQSILIDFNLKARLAPWLMATLKSNYNHYTTATMLKQYGTGAYYGPSGSGAYSRGGSIDGNYNFVAMLQSLDNKVNIFGQSFNISGIVATELYGNTAKNSWYKSTNGGLVVPAVFAFSNSKNKIEPVFNFTPANTRTIGVSGIFNISWKDQVFVELTARNDFLSTLTYPSYISAGKNNYSVFYPSINTSWVFTDTFRNFIPSWFGFGKLRASLARVGMGTSAYATSRGYGIYSQSSIYLPDRSGSVLNANPNLGTAFNSNLKPEVQQSIELGADLRFFDERLNIDFAYYKTNTFNQIMSVGTVIETGAASKMINAGNIQNQGIELQLDATPIRTSNFRWSLGGNFTLNRGKIIKLGQGIKEWQLMGGYDAAPEIWAFEGGSFGVLTSYLNGQYSSPLARFEGEKGDPRNGKMLIDYSQDYGPQGATLPIYVPISRYDRNEKGDRDRHILGKVEPDFTLSLNTSFSYKNFDVYIQGDGRFGGNYYSNTWKYSIPRGSLKSTLEGRSKEHGGIERINYKGEKVFDGYMIDGVFVDGAKAPVQNPDGSSGDLVDVGGLTYADAIAKKNIRPTMTGAWYMLNYGWGMPIMPGAIQDNTWFCLRELTIGYRLPQNICKKFKTNYLRIGFTARNLGYIINRLSDGLNPASISSNNPLQPMDIGAVPFYRTYALNLTLRF